VIIIIIIIIITYEAESVN